MRGGERVAVGADQRGGQTEAAEASDMSEIFLGWRCSFQDFRNWRTADLREPHPPIRWADFPTREDAEREARIQRQGGMTACVSLVPAPKHGTGRRRSKLPLDLPVQHRPGFGT